MVTEIEIPTGMLQLTEVDKHKLLDSQRYSLFMKIEPEICTKVFVQCKNKKNRTEKDYLLIELISRNKEHVASCWISKYEYNTLKFE